MAGLRAHLKMPGLIIAGLSGRNRRPVAGSYYAGTPRPAPAARRAASNLHIGRAIKPSPYFKQCLANSNPALSRANSLHAATPCLVWQPVAARRCYQAERLIITTKGRVGAGQPTLSDYTYSMFAKASREWPSFWPQWSSHCFAAEVKAADTTSTPGEALATTTARDQPAPSALAA